MAELDILLGVIKSSCQKIASLIRDASSFELSTLSEEYNLSGDNAKQLDLISNTILKPDLSKSNLVRCIGSEEEESIYETNFKQAPYMVCYDPLDGSSNIDVNITTGTIFAIYKYSALHSCLQNQQGGMQNIWQI